MTESVTLSSGFHRDNELYLDSGATGLFCDSKDLLTEMKKLSITIANGDKLVTDLTGNLNLPVKINNHLYLKIYGIDAWDI
ncbi:hypothetical protein WA026_015680 [Henosepilachna vigintioctopunctata]|uniref:Uncharacterized protein n=1 Tax=Henosepilachna vigintioctopunctata TaxID=420089 RepID=A0AAW1V2R9_9CUCU